MSELNQPGPIPPPTNLHPHPRKSIKHPHTYSHLRPPRLSTAPTLFLPSLWIFSLCPSILFPSISLEGWRGAGGGAGLGGWKWHVCVSHVKAHPGPTAAHKQGETQAQAGIGCYVHICWLVRCGALVVRVEPKNGTSCWALKGQDAGAYKGERAEGHRWGEGRACQRTPHPTPPGG